MDNICDFLKHADYVSIPTSVTNTAKLLTLDLIGVLAAAAKLDAGEIARNHAVKHWSAGQGGESAKLLFDGRHTSLPGFGFAMATQLDSLDAHDGWQPSKGHAGAALFPALAAFAQAAPTVSGQQALSAMVAGYEIAYRAAAALHSTVPDYHTSGAWNGLGCVAIGALLRNTNPAVLRNALGVAEYHGPRSQMMREIANPSMLHDGTGFGAPTGIYALLIAEDGFTGAPAATIEFDDAQPAWQDLGHNWLTSQQYIKPYPVCRWAHAPIDAALKLRRLHELGFEDIESVEISTFAYSADLNNDIPDTPPRAQYSLAWPVAAAFVRGRVTVDEVMESSFGDEKIGDLLRRTSVRVDPELEAGYPARRLAKVQVKLRDGTILQSGTTEASGGPDPQPTEQEVVNKFRIFAGSVMSDQRLDEIESSVLSLDQPAADFKALIDLLATPL